MGLQKDTCLLMERKRNKTHLCFTVFLFFIFFSVSTIFSSAITDTKRYSPVFDTDFQKSEEKIKEGMVSEGRAEEVSLGLGRRFLSGLGSWPPRCNNKCGSCTPCRPVHVPVPPGTPVTAEYYPEAWRCKCGNKLYMP